MSGKTIICFWIIWLVPSLLLVLAASKWEFWGSQFIFGLPIVALSWFGFAAMVSTPLYLSETARPYLEKIIPKRFNRVIHKLEEPLQFIGFFGWILSFGWFVESVFGFFS